MTASDKHLSSKAFSARTIATSRRRNAHRDTISPSEIAQLLQRGMALHKAGQFWQAHEYYRAILDRDPSQPDALHLTALVAIEAGGSMLPFRC